MPKRPPLSKLESNIISAAENTNADRKGSSNGLQPPQFRPEVSSFMPSSSIQMKAESEISGNQLGANASQGISASSKNSLPAAVQEKMGTAFGHDFTEVNVHQNSTSASFMGAKAYTQGRDVHFAPGQYNPVSAEGQELIGHELTHVVQQSQGRVPVSPQLKNSNINDDSALEREADQMGKKSASGQQVEMSYSSHSSSANGAIQRKTDDLTSPHFRTDENLEKAHDKKELIVFGAKGDSVTRLQNGLISAGHALPVSGADGHFGNETKKAVEAFQTAHGLSSDGRVGQDTMQSLDKYLRMESGPDPLGPKPGSPEKQLADLIAKVDTLSAAESEEAKTLLMSLNGDEFKRVLKNMAVDGSLMKLFAKLNLGQVFDMTANMAMEVVIPIVHFKPGPDTVDADFTRANQIYNPHGIEIEKGDRVDISEKTTKKILGADSNLNEFTTDQATAEELKMINLNRMKGRITGYWVPNMDSSRGEGIMKSSLVNIPDDRTSVVTNTSARAQDTFPHEVGHVLGLDHSADPNNLMAGGGIRNIAGAGIDKLTAAQLALIKSSAFIEVGKKGVGK